MFCRHDEYHIDHEVMQKSKYIVFCFNSLQVSFLAGMFRKLYKIRDYEGNMKVLCSITRNVDQRESALTYISSVFHKSVASASLRGCSHCHGDDRHHNAPAGHSECLLSAVADSLDLHYHLLVGRCDDLN